MYTSIDESDDDGDDSDDDIDSWMTRMTHKDPSYDCFTHNHHNPTTTPSTHSDDDEKKRGNVINNITHLKLNNTNDEQATVEAPLTNLSESEPLIIRIGDAIETLT
jgi:hypothetical protein